MMRRFPFQLTVGLLTFVIGIAAASYWLSSHQPEQKQIQSSLEQETKSSLDGLWLMGNASSGTEADTMIRIVQHGQQVQGIIARPAGEYEKEFGVKPGDIEFEGLLEGNLLRGQTHSYSSLDFEKKCPGLQKVFLKNFEMSVAENNNALTGWTDDSQMDFKTCATYIAGRTSYTFRRIK